jgi:hypothetical protein
VSLAPFKHQLDLVDYLKAAPRFNGADIDDERDTPRLTGQLRAILDFMADGQWRTLAGIAAATGAPEASVSAQLRNARKQRFGAHTVEREHVGGGLYRYRVANP